MNANKTRNAALLCTSLLAVTAASPLLAEELRLIIGVVTRRTR